MTHFNNIFTASNIEVAIANATTAKGRRSLETDYFKKTVGRLVNTVKALGDAFQSSGFIVVDGIQFNVSDYQLPSNMVKVIEHSTVYLSVNGKYRVSPILTMKFKVDEGVSLLTPSELSAFLSFVEDNLRGNLQTNSVDKDKLVTFNELGLVNAGGKLLSVGDVQVQDRVELASAVTYDSEIDWSLYAADTFTALNEVGTCEWLLGAGHSFQGGNNVKDSE